MSELSPEQSHNQPRFRYDLGAVAIATVGGAIALGGFVEHSSAEYRESSRSQAEVLADCVEALDNLAIDGVITIDPADLPSSTGDACQSRLSSSVEIADQIIRTDTIETQISFSLEDLESQHLALNESSDRTGSDNYMTGIAGFIGGLAGFMGSAGVILEIDKRRRNRAGVNSEPVMKSGSVQSA